MTQIFFRMSGDFHSRVVAAIKRKEFGDPEGEGGPKKRKKKGVNPLACLKKKPKPVKRLQKLGPVRDVEESKSEVQKKKRKRNRKRKKPEVGEDKPSENQ